jgi:soluble lytic murein transglycosylase-like protein
MAILLCAALAFSAASKVARGEGSERGQSGASSEKDGRHGAVVHILTDRFRVSAVRAEHIVDAVERAAGALHVPMSLILAIIQTESSFDPHATSSAGAIGLMQVMPATHRDFAPPGSPRADIREPAGNIFIGTSILRRYLDQANGDMNRALDRYSGGTHGYAKRVYARWRYFSDFADPAAPESASAAALATHAPPGRPDAADAVETVIRAASQVALQGEKSD